MTSNAVNKSSVKESAKTALLLQGTNESESVSDVEVVYEHSDIDIVDPRNPFIRIVSKAANGNSIEFTVSHLPVPSFVANSFLFRRNEEVYSKHVGKTYALDLFPPKLKEGVYYQPQYIQLSRYVMACRIRRLVLIQEIDSFTTETKELMNLQSICQEKRTALSNRIATLENELSYLMSVDGAGPASRFNALLLSTHGWKAINFFFHRELKRIQTKIIEEATGNGNTNQLQLTSRSTTQNNNNHNHNNNNTLVELGEEVDETITVDVLTHCWKLLQFWRVVRCVEARCREGEAAYPHKHDTDELQNGLNNASLEGSLSRSAEINNINTSSADPFAPAAVHMLSATNSAVLSKQNSYNAEYELGNRSADAEAERDRSGGPKLQHSNTIDSLMSFVHSTQHAIDSSVREGGNATARSLQSFRPSLDLFASSKPSVGAAASVRSGASTEKEKDRHHSTHGPGMPSHRLQLQQQLQQREHDSRLDVKLIHQFKSSQIIASWKDVCELLHCENLGSITAARAVQELLLADPDLHSLVDRSTLVNLSFGLSEAVGDEDTSVFISAALCSVADHVADAIEKQLLHAVRMLPRWLITLEELRRERIKSTGGKLLVKDKIEIEIDATGKRKTYPIPDIYVDTDILHNVLQRLHFQVVSPQIEKKLQLIKDKRNALKGELACLIQFGFELVCPFIQRNVRRVRQQRRYQGILRLLSYLSMHAAVVFLQSYVRMRKTRRWFLQLVQDTALALRHAAATQIQRIARGYVAYNKYLAYLRHKKAMSEWFAITKYQAMIRGFLARHRHKQRLAANAADRLLAIQVWGVTKIQKIVRGYLARKVLVPSLRLRKTLSPDMLRLVEVYLQKGDLWQFLRQLDAELHRLRNEIAFNEQREDTMAATFLQKVLTRRANEFDSSWSIFTEAVDAHKAGTAAKVQLKVTSKVSAIIESNNIGLQMEQQDGKLTALGKPSTAVLSANLIGSVMDAEGSQLIGRSSSLSNSPSNRANRTSNQSKTSPSKAKHEPFQHEQLFAVGSIDFGNVSGEVASSAHSGSLQIDTSGHLPNSSPMRQSSPLSSPSRRSQLSVSSNSRSGRSGASRKTTVTHSGEEKPPKAPPGALLRRALTSSIQSGVDSELHKLKNSSNRTTQLANEIKQVYGQEVQRLQLSQAPPPTRKSRQSRQDQPQHSSGMSAATSDWLGTAAAAAPASSSLAPLVMTSTASGASSSPLSRATRTANQQQLSQSMTGRNANSSPRSRTSSPTRQLQQSQHRISDNNNSNDIRGNSNATKALDIGNSLLLDVPRGLEDTWEKLLRAASVRCYVPKFFGAQDPSEAFALYLQLPSGLAKMRYEQEAWEWAKSTIHKMYSKGLVYIKDALPLSKCTMFLKSAECPAPLLAKCIECIEALSAIGVPISLGYTHAATIAQATSITGQQLTAAQELQLIREEQAELRRQRQLLPEREQEAQPEPIDPTIGARLLVNMVEEGTWLNLSADIDEIIMQAAYLCVPFIPYDSSKSDSEQQDQSNSSEEEMGQRQFTAHVQELQLLSPEGQRDSIRRRYRAALLLSTPYVLRLKTDGILSVRDLLAVPLPTLQLPRALMEQIEALLSVVVTVAANAKIVPTNRDYLTQPKDLFTIPVMYDPKFQRSPTDPYGRPARLGDILKQSVQKKQGKHQQQTNGNSSDNGNIGEDNVKGSVDYQVMPGGLWEIREDEQEQDDNEHDHVHVQGGVLTDKMWHFNASSISTASSMMQSESHGPTAAAATATATAKNSGNATSSNSASDKLKSDTTITAKQRETSWNKRNYQDIVQKARQAEEEKRMAPMDPKAAQPLVSIGMRGPNNEFLTNLVPLSAMENAERTAIIAHQKRDSRDSKGNSNSKGKRGAKVGALVKPKLTMKLSKQELESTERMHAYHKDITLRMQDDFVRPYVCSYPHCGQTFSRLYTLRVHEKSHVAFPAYHQHKRELKVFLDDDISAVQREREEEIEARVSLSQPILRELDQLSRSASANVSGSASRGHTGMGDFGGCSEDYRLGTASGTGSRSADPLQRLGTASSSSRRAASRGGIGGVGGAGGGTGGLAVRPFYSRGGPAGDNVSLSASASSFFLPPIADNPSQQQQPQQGSVASKVSFKLDNLQANSVSSLGSADFNLAGVTGDDLGEQFFLFA